jgi:hypothetical protein
MQSLLIPIKQNDVLTLGKFIYKRFVASCTLHATKSIRVISSDLMVAELEDANGMIGFDHFDAISCTALLHLSMLEGRRLGYALVDD